MTVGLDMSLLSPDISLGLSTKLTFAMLGKQGVKQDVDQMSCSLHVRLHIHLLAYRLEHLYSRIPIKCAQARQHTQSGKGDGKRVKVVQARHEESREGLGCMFSWICFPSSWQSGEYSSPAGLLIRLGDTFLITLASSVKAAGSAPRSGDFEGRRYKVLTFTSDIVCRGKIFAQAPHDLDEWD